MTLLIQPPVIAHRGASYYAPENTLAAFRYAKTLGVNWVEFDVMLTQDNEAVVIHDESLDRTTNGRGLVADFSYQALSLLDAGSWFHPQFANEKISTLREVLLLLRELQLSANIEIKPQWGREEQTVKKTLAVLQEFTDQSFLVSSFSLRTLELVRQYSLDMPLGFLMDEWMVDWKNISDMLQCVSVNVNHEILSIEKAKMIKASKCLLLAYTVNDRARAHELFSWGVDAVFSDDPSVVV